MRCRKCQHDNPEDIMFCEECDHQLNQPYKAEVTIPPMYLAAAALILGAIAVIFSLVLKYGWYIPVFTGAIGLFLSTFALNKVRFSSMSNKTAGIVMSMSATALSVIGFVLGVTLI